MTIFVGHDPGKKGFISWISEAGEVLGSVPQPLTDPQAKGDTFDRVGMRDLISEIKGPSGFHRVVWTVEDQLANAGRSHPQILVIQAKALALWEGMLWARGIPASHASDSDSTSAARSAL